QPTAAPPMAPSVAFVPGLGVHAAIASKTPAVITVLIASTSQAEQDQERRMRMIESVDEQVVNQNPTRVFTVTSMSHNGATGPMVPIQGFLCTRANGWPVYSRRRSCG